MAVQISGNDITVPRDGSFTRNVTIGGTLTYEDVTNVDSIGLITARSGVKFGASGTTVVGDSSGIGIGTDNPRGSLHILKGGSGFDYQTTGNLIVEDNDDSTIQILAPSTHASQIHFGDDDNGMVGRIGYAHTDNSMRFTLTNNEKVRINSNGKILVNHTNGRGVGNSNVRLIQVEGTGGESGIAVVRNSANTSGAGLMLGKSRTNSVGGNTIVQDGDKLGVISFCGADGVDLLSTSAQITGEVDGTPGENDMPGRLVFKTASDGSAGTSERLKIDSNGDVTIGGVTNAGGNRLLVSESHTEAFVNPTDSTLRITNDDTSANNNQTSISFTCSTTGVGADSAIVSQADDASGNSSLQFWTDTTNGMTEKMRILSDGAVVINATARPVVGTEYLGVHGGSANNTVGIAAAVSHKNGIPFFASNGSNTTSQRLIRFAAGSGGDTRGTITWNGSNIVYGGSSDYRLKKNVTSLTDGITKLKQLKPITFDWIKETDNNNVMGFLAHEVKEVIPQVVTGEKDEVDSEGKPEYQELDYGGMTPLIVAALQEAVSEIETLKAEVAALKSN